MRAFAAVVAFVIAGSCLVDRRSRDFECQQTTDCEIGRACSPEGFCVAGAAGSLICDDLTRTCAANCNNSAPCGALTCPAGFECTINCSSNGACSSIDCGDADSCTVDCSAPNACNSIICGSGGKGECDIDCSTNNACGTVNCSGACACDVDCDGGPGCAPSSCPLSGADCSDSDNGCDANNFDCDTCS